MARQFTLSSHPSSGKISRLGFAIVAVASSGELLALGYGELSLEAHAPLREGGVLDAQLGERVLELPARLCLRDDDPLLGARSEFLQ